MTTSRVRYLLIIWVFMISAIVYLDRTNISIAGLSSRRITASARSSWAGCSAPSCSVMRPSRFRPAGLSGKLGPRLTLTLA